MNYDDMILENSTAIWNMPLTQGEVLGSYSGAFVFKCYLNPMEQISANKLYRGLIGPHSSFVSETDGLLAFSLCQLKYRIVKAPPFWFSSLSEDGMPGNIPDLNIIQLIFEHAFDAERMFREKMATERETVLKKTIQTAEDLIQQEGKEE